MRYVFQRMWSLLLPAEKRKLFPLIFMMAFGALLELAGLGLMMPVIAMLANPELAEQNKILNAIHDFINPASNESFILTLCGIVVAAFIAKNAFLALSTKLQTDFVFKLTKRLASKLFEAYMRAPYAYHLKKNSSSILNNVSQIGGTANGLFVPAMMFLSESIVVGGILFTLLFFAPLATLGLGLASLALLFGLYAPFKKRNLLLGERRFEASRKTASDVMQGFEGVKECKICNCEALLSARHEQHQKELCEADAARNFFNQLPRFAIEAFVILAGMGTLAIFVASGVATGSIVLRLSLIAVALIRLMPSFSRMQYQLASIRQNLAGFNIIYEDLRTLSAGLESEAGSAKPPLDFTRSIEIKGLSFAYDEARTPVVEGFSCEIAKNESVAFIGQTGCGKTTLMDLILGLLTPSKGDVLVDGRSVRENLASWQKKIGYVPQTIFLMDASIRENVAFGEEPAAIDDARVARCLETAQLLDFVESLPEKLESKVGERGVRLSGGQRQRIGIARALYRNPEVLALDEATSALDNDTEKAFVDALRTLKGKLTIIMIAHRLTTVQNCDRVLELSPDRK